MPEQNQPRSISDRLLVGQYLTQEEYSALPDSSNVTGVALTYAMQDNIVIPAVAIFADGWSKHIYDVAKKYRELGLPVILLHPSSDRPRVAFTHVPVQSPEELDSAIRIVTQRYKQIISAIHSIAQ